MIREAGNGAGNEAALRSRLQHVLVGREGQLETIKIQFDHVLRGNSARTVITGDTGIGKTALLKAALTDLTMLNATCVYGKFEQYKNDQPYIPVIRIIESITNHILTLPKKKLIHITSRLVNSLGKDAAMLAQIVPKISGITGRQSKPRVVDYQKLKIRLEAAFQRFITVAAQELYPLVIAVDDLQWADNPSWNIIKAINDPPTKHDLYLLFAYRNNLTEYRTGVTSLLHELAATEHLTEINLNSFSRQAVKEMLAYLFADNLENCDSAARLLHRQTLGNPLHLKQMINLLLDNKKICPNPQNEKWRLAAKDVINLHFPVGMEDMINRKINALDHHLKEFLETLACIGSSFTMELLGKVFHRSKNTLAENLQALCRAGLIIAGADYHQEGQAAEFEFFHDRIYQTVYGRINPGQRAELHYRLAAGLLTDPDKNFVAENLVSITTHLLNCREIIKREGTGESLTVDLYLAGLKAKESAAVEHALKLFSLCQELLPPDCWQRDYRRTLNIKLELAQCRYLCGLHDDSKQLFEEMLAHAAARPEQAEIKKQYMILSAYTGNHARVIDLGLQALRHLGVKINRQNLKIKIEIAGAILLGMFLFRDSRLIFIRNAPLVTDKRIVSALEILMIMAASANLTDNNLFILLMLKIGNISATHGNSPYSPAAYAAYSLLQGSVLGNYNKGKKLKDISLDLAELFDDDIFGCTTYFCLGTFVAHWTAPARDSLHYLQKAFDCGLRAGDYLYCGYSISAMIELKYSMGGPLDQLDKFLQLHEKYGQKMACDLVLLLTNIFKEHIAALSPPDHPAGSDMITDKQIAQLDTIEKMIYYLLKIQRMYLDGEIEAAHAVLQTSIKQLNSIMGYIIQVDFVFYFLLVSLERMNRQQGSPDKRRQRACKKFRKKLKIWAKLSPENHWGKHLLVEALCLSHSKQKHRAAGLFDQAIKHAAAGGNLHLEALANSLAARYYSGNEKVAKVYARDAARLFDQWGAGKTAGRIRANYGIIDEITPEREDKAAAAIATPQSAGTKESSFNQQMLKERQQEMEQLELEAAFASFLTSVCRDLKADYGAILLEHQDRISIQYQQRTGRPVEKHQLGIDPEEIDYLPKKVLRYAGRTYEEIIMSAKPTEGPFAADDHIHSKPGISIICLPLKYNRIFQGLIYLESEYDHQFDTAAAEYVRHLSFYLVAKQALEDESEINGKKFISREVQGHLTERETQVLEHMARGLSNSEISEKLRISSSTVKTYTLNLYRKLEVNNRVQAVIKGKALNLIK